MEKYKKTEWIPEVTLVSAENLNKVEDQLKTLTDKSIELSSQLEQIANREYISIDTFGNDMASFQKCFDYCNDNGIGILIPNKEFIIDTPIILRENGTYYIKGTNTNMNDASSIKSRGILRPKTKLFIGELTDNNTTVYMTLENVRIYPEVGANGYTKKGTYVFYNFNLFGLVLRNVTCRYIDVFCQGYISKASVIENIRVSFIKSALFKGNEYNGSFIADSQITNCYFSGAYPVTLFQGIGVNTTVSNCFFDYFKYMQNSLGFYNNHFTFKDCTIGIFYRWFADNYCRGKVDIIHNKIDNVSCKSLIDASSTNFVIIDNEMSSGVAGAFVECTFLENIYERKTDKSKVCDNRFTDSDNVFIKSNGYMQVEIKGNSYSNVSGKVYDLSFRDTTNGKNKFGEFYCDALDNQIVNSLPTVRSGNVVYCFEGQKCIMDGIEYTLINEIWTPTSYLNYYQSDEIVVGKYLGKDLYRKVITGTQTVETTGFKNINIPEADNLFFISNLSYWGSNKLPFNNIPKDSVFTDSVGCIIWNDGSIKRLMLYNNGNSPSLTFDYSIVIEYTKI